MADLYPNIHFPSVDFSALGDLPKVMDEAAGQRAVKEGLAGLKDSSPDELDKAATKILSNPNVSTAAIEQAMRIQTQANQRRELARKEKEMTIYQQSIGPLQELYAKMYGSKGGTGSESSGGETFNPFSTPGVPGTPPPASGTPPVGAPLVAPGTGAPPPIDYFARPPGAIPGVGPQSALPPSALPPTQQMAFNRNPAPPPGPPMLPIPGGQTPPITGPQPNEPYPGIPPGQSGQRIGGLTPTNQVLAQAQQPPTPPAPPPTQLAGPPPTPDTVPAPVAPQGAVPPWLQGAQMGAVPAQPQTAPAAAPPREVPRTVPGLPPEVGAKLGDLANMAASLGPRASPTQRAFITQTYNNLLEQTKWSPEVKQWQSERMDRFTRGEPDISLADWKLFNSNSSQFISEGLETYKHHSQERDKSGQVRTDLDALSRIVKNPKFFSGPGSEDYAYWANAATAARDAALSLGVPKGVIEGISEGLGLGKDLERITEPAKLQQVFTAISNQAIYSKLGSLGSNISNSDRTFVQAANPSLLMSKGANDVLIDMMSALAQRKVDIGDMLDKYREKAGVRVSGPQINQLVKRYNDDHPLFTDSNNVPNALGKRIMDASAPPSIGLPGQVVDFISNAPGRVAAALAPSPAPEGAPTPPRVTPTGGFFEANLPFNREVMPGEPTAPAAGVAARQAGLAPPGPGPNLPPRSGTIIPPSLNAPMAKPAPSMAEDLALAGEPVTAQHEGQIYYDQDGKRAGIIRDGKPVPFRRLNR